MAKKKISDRHARRQRVTTHVQYNATIRASTAMKARATAAALGESISKFTDRALLAACTTPAPKETT